MNAYALLQNALLLGCVFATYWLTGTWWGCLFLMGWLIPSGRKCDCEKADSK